MPKTRRRSAHFDALETRDLLSGAGHAHAAAPVSRPSPAGFFSSMSSTTTHGRGTNETLKTTFTGQSLSQGPAKATSTELLDAKTDAMLSVQVVLQTAHGSVHMAFGPSDVTTNLSAADGTEMIATYHITSATGVFAHETGTGTVTFWSLSGATQSNLTITPSGS